MYIVNLVDIATFVVSHRATEAQRYTEGRIRELKVENGKLKIIAI